MESQTTLHSSSRAESQAIVIGGGLAGTAIAEALQRRGLSVSLIERHPRLSQEASGQAAGIAQPILHREATAKMRLSLRGFSLLRAHLQRLEGEGHPICHKRCGVLQLAHKPELSERFTRALSLLRSSDPAARLIDQSGEASRLCGLGCAHGGVFFPQALWLSPADLCRANVRRPRIRLLFNRNARAFFYKKKKGLWYVQDSNKRHIASARYLILACAADSQNFPGLQWLPLQRVRGQTFLLPWPKSKRSLKCIVAYDGYIIPEMDARKNCLVGASFEAWNPAAEKDPDQNIRLYARLLSVLPGLKMLSSVAHPSSLKGLPTRVGFRSSSPDRLPLCGALPEPGLYLSTAYGSHGLIFASLCAELIAAQICREALPIEDDLALALCPSRYFRQFESFSMKGKTCWA